jgi:hypothetical protein
VIANGQAVILEYGASTIRAIAPTGMPTADQVVGFAMNATTAAGQQVRVLKDGFGTAALPGTVDVILLNATTNDQTFTNERVFFRDSGGLGGTFGFNQNLKCVFDAGPGKTWSLQFVTDVNNPATFFSFDGFISSPDRLGTQESTDGVTWTNISVPWMQTSSESVAPWVEEFGGGGTSFSDPAAINGWILPISVSRANSLGYVTGTPVNINSRYVRFWFISDDGSAGPLGWNIGLSRSLLTGAPLYIDKNDLSKVTRISGGTLVGRVAGADASLGSILVQRSAYIDSLTEITYVDLDPSFVLDPLASAQTDYQGTTELYTSGGVIANGQAVILEYGASTIRAIAPTSMPSADQVIGIAMNATTGAGQQVRVLKDGFGTAALVVPTVILNATTNNQTFTDARVLFKDSGVFAGNNYGQNENFKSIFDAGLGSTWSLQFVTDVNDPATFFSFEHYASTMNDRLGIQESTDGVNWANISVPWMQKSTIATAPWGPSFVGGAYNAAAATNGWILPGNLTRANELGYVTGTPVNVNSRYVRLWFLSDNTNIRLGWNIGLSRAIPVDVPLYIAVGDLNRATIVPGGALIGRTASLETSFLGSILLRRSSGVDGAREVSFLSLDPSIVLDPLASAQTDYRGTTELYTSGGVIANGQAVVLKYGSTAIRAIAPTGMPEADEVIGIAMNATTAAGEQVRVLKSGFGTAAVSFAPQPAAVEVVLNGATDGQTFTDARVIFKDSGVFAGNYGQNENFKCIFDAGASESWSLQFVTDVNDTDTFFEFEPTATMTDRLGIQESTDGISWNNVSVPWMQTSANAVAPWSETYASGNRATSINGWILPQLVSYANTNGYVTGTPVAITTRYVRFWFVSNNMSNRRGWNIELNKIIRAGVPLYIDANDLSKVTIVPGGALVGRTAGADTTSGSILVRR